MPLTPDQLRCQTDFQYWCRTCCTIKDKLTGADIPFELNAPQRRVAAMLEEDRHAGRPIRLIMLKARQWGGSTLIQTYMAWIQSCHCRNWHSLICTQVKDSSANIRAMYSKILDNYPEHLWDGDEKPRFSPFERSQNTRIIAGRGCRVTISSIENQDNIRGSDFAMAHLSEVAFWRSTPTHSPQDVIRAVCGSIALVPYSMIVMESTANGVGNYFHHEWMRCSEGRGDKRCIFVPWYEIDIYRLTPPDPDEFSRSLNTYEQYLRDTHGCSLEQIYWYRCKRSEYITDAQMQAEFPTTPTEAFAATGANVFAPEHVEQLRTDCFEPAVGDIDCSRGVIDFSLNPQGLLKLWKRPCPEGRYIAAVDIGGRTDSADFSVISVMRSDGDKPEVVAQWRGHIDHDRLASIAMDIGRFYNTALLVVESNSLESDSGTGIFMLQQLDDRYPNLYRRYNAADPLHPEQARIGFHTNRQTKEIAISTLIQAVRDGKYTERDNDACNEFLTYERTPTGSYAAKPGCHDDILMTRAIALQVLAGSRSHIAAGSSIPRAYAPSRGYW